MDGKAAAVQKGINADASEVNSEAFAMIVKSYKCDASERPCPVMIAFLDRLAYEPDGLVGTGDQGVGLTMGRLTTGHQSVLRQLLQSSTGDQRPRPSAVQRRLPAAFPEEDPRC